MSKKSKTYKLNERFYHQGVSIGDSFAIYEIIKITDNFIHYEHVDKGELTGKTAKCTPEFFARVYKPIERKR